MRMPIVDPPTFEQLAHLVIEQSIPGLVPHRPIFREEWRWEGKLHSVDDHPSVIIDSGKELQWHKYGWRHREERIGPAWIKNNGIFQIYYNMDEIHRSNGPAMIEPESQKWYHLGKLHRKDGPAVIYIDGKVEWHWRGTKYNLNDWAVASCVDPELFTMLKLEYG
jgi:hypothetical protein